LNDGPLKSFSCSPLAGIGHIQDVGEDSDAIEFAADAEIPIDGILAPIAPAGVPSRGGCDEERTCGRLVTSNSRANGKPSI